jgi:hypothetical protein
VDYKDFCNIGFSGGMGFYVVNTPNDPRTLLSVDFETGECLDEDEVSFSIREIDHFFYFDGSPVKGQK